MNRNTFNSSDSLRGSEPLQYSKTVSLGKMELQSGEILSDLVQCYETYGELNRENDNAVLVFHALSGDSHIASHNSEDDSGWWEILVGPEKHLDTNRYFVICANVLGGCRGSAGPLTINPDTGSPYGKDFPEITIQDMVDAQVRLLKHLGIGMLRAVIGASMGGQLAMDFGIRFSKLTEKVIVIASTPRLTSQTLAFDIVGRNAIQQDPDFFNGDYSSKNAIPGSGLAIARMIGHITYLSPDAMNTKFEEDRNNPQKTDTEFESLFSVGSYLGYQGEKFVHRFDANSYITLTKAMDHFNLGGTDEELEEAFSKSDADWLVLSFTSDWLFPPSESEKTVKALIQTGKKVSYCCIESQAGHDAFLLPYQLDTYGVFVKGFLSRQNSYCVCTDETEGTKNKVDIYTASRADFDYLMKIIPKDSSVLDLGCGNGDLLSCIAGRNQNNFRGIGVELNQNSILEGVSRGIPVVQADLNKAIPQFSDKQFDYVILSLTLQAIYDVKGVLAEMLRIGKKGIVSFPNFAYSKLRDKFYHEGKAPDAEGVLKYRWHNTPNIRFLSITDFQDLCEEMNIKIHRIIALDTEQNREVAGDINLLADMAICVISSQ